LRRCTEQSRLEQVHQVAVPVADHLQLSTWRAHGRTSFSQVHLVRLPKAAPASRRATLELGIEVAGVLDHAHAAPATRPSSP